MNDELAEQLLARVMGWGPAEIDAHVPYLQTLARLKYDEYEGYRAGERFVENLAKWLQQFGPSDRSVALEFVEKQLVFVSRAELEHAIELVYPHVIRPLIREKVALQIRAAPFEAKRIAAAPEFRVFERSLLVLGLADGARLDRLRRACPGLSHEQFLLHPEVSAPVLRRMTEKLGDALKKQGQGTAPVFRHVLLVDDFSGSGYTLLHYEKKKWGGKLERFSKSLRQWKRAGFVAEDAGVTPLVYIGSSVARDAVNALLARRRLDWLFHIIQLLPDDIRVRAPEVVKLCRDSYDSVLTDEHKGSAELGFRDVALPLVLSHNTPNDSVAMLWGDTNAVPESRRFSALFPRYERHHKDRP